LRSEVQAQLAPFLRTVAEASHAVLLVDYDGTLAPFHAKRDQAYPYHVAPILAEAMGLDNRLRVFAAAGYYDLTTPYLSQEYVFNHLDLPAELRPNLIFRRYRAGHQIYTSPEALRQLTDDVKAFITGPETP
jgi:carboxypeptidase C (cathepsin A)